jgi:hypothetical protein
LKPQGPIYKLSPSFDTWESRRHLLYHKCGLSINAVTSKHLMWSTPWSSIHCEGAIFFSEAHCDSRPWGFTNQLLSRSPIIYGWASDTYCDVKESTTAEYVAIIAQTASKSENFCNDQRGQNWTLTDGKVGYILAVISASAALEHSFQCHVYLLITSSTLPQIPLRRLNAALVVVQILCWQSCACVLVRVRPIITTFSMQSMTFAHYWAIGPGNGGRTSLWSFLHTFYTLSKHMQQRLDTEIISKL